MKLEDVEGLLDKLSHDFNVPKPDYQVWEARLIKRLKPIKTKLGGELRISGPRPFDFGAIFHYSGKATWLTFLTDPRHQVNKTGVIHEFLHYKHYVERGYKPPEDFEEEERRTKRETRWYLKKLKEAI